MRRRRGRYERTSLIVTIAAFLLPTSLGLAVIGSLGFEYYTLSTYWPCCHFPSSGGTDFLGESDLPRDRFERRLRHVPREEGVARLVKNYPQLEATDPRRDPLPLVVAIREGLMDAVPELLKYGADPNLLDDRTGEVASAALHEAVKAYPADVVDGAASAEDELEARRQRMRWVIQELLEHHANPNIRDGRGRTPLFYARHEVVAKMLLDAGADPNAVDGAGDSVFH